MLDWLFGRRRPPPRRSPAPAGMPLGCSSCGRTDLPEAGDWDPPICLECDAALNFDADIEPSLLDGDDDRDDDDRGW